MLKLLAPNDKESSEPQNLKNSDSEDEKPSSHPHLSQ